MVFRNMGLPAQEEINEVKFAKMTPAEHLAEAKRLMGKGNPLYEKHFAVIPKDSEEYKYVQAFYQKLVDRINEQLEKNKRSP